MSNLEAIGGGAQGKIMSLPAFLVEVEWDFTTYPSLDGAAKITRMMEMSNLYNDHLRNAGKVALGGALLAVENLHQEAA